MEVPKYKALFFDFDGTLVQSAPYYKRFSSALEASSVEYFGGDGLVKLERYRRDFNGAGEMIVKDFPALGKIWYRKILLINPLKYFKYDSELMDFLKQMSYYDLFVYSNSPKEQIVRVLKAKGVDPIIFKGIVAWEGNKPMPKPNVDNLKQILDGENIDKNNCIFIGDSWDTDLKPAESLGIKTIFFKKRSSFKTLTSLINDIQ